MRNRSQAKAFTLLELMIVILIIGVMMAMIVPTVARALKMGQVAQTREIIREISLGMEAFKKDFKTYPPSRPGTLTSTDPAVGKRSTGRANLYHYLCGPMGAGWGFSAGGLMPFGGTPTRVYGPYYETITDRLYWETESGKTVVGGFLDAFKPPGVILYFCGEVDATTNMTVFLWPDNNGPAGHGQGKNNYASNDYFLDCVALKSMFSATGSSQVQRFMRQDYLLGSPGADGRYGAVKLDATGNKTPCKRKDGDYDDVGNWN